MLSIKRGLELVAGAWFNEAPSQPVLFRMPVSFITSGSNRVFLLPVVLLELGETETYFEDASGRERGGSTSRTFD